MVQRRADAATAARIGRAARILLAALLAAASTLAAAEDRVLVFAAASLKNALDEVAAHAPVKAVASYASSSALARQIVAGAPAEVFISANVEWMDYVEKAKRLLPGTRIDLLGNRLVLVAPAASRVQATPAPGFPLARLLGADGRLAIGQPDHVPAGQYARAALQSLGVWESVKDRLAPAENVRAALALVARGETPLGIVYATDAADEPGVRVLGAFSAGSHPPIVYPAALTTAAKGEAARRLLEYLGSPAARRLFEKHGFAPLH
jgi:molybdate transport system substrate-binding protein